MRVEAEVALKEWAVVCAALGDGRQSLLLRKGGIHERGPDHTFVAEHRRFVMLPTYFHAHDAGRARDLVPEVHAELAELVALTAAAPSELRIDLHAEVTGLWHVRELGPLLALAGRHVLSDACVADRFAYRNKPGLWVLAVRVRRLARTVVLADRPGYAGCVSWVDLDETVGGEAAAVVSDEEYARREAGLGELLGARWVA